jgi:hypothetical protein
MKVIYARQPIPEPPEQDRYRIFLAGPTLRKRKVPCLHCKESGLLFSRYSGCPHAECDKGTLHLKSWRIEALNILKQRQFDGTVFVPEEEGWGDFTLSENDDQIGWELLALSRSTGIIFWIPRGPHLPGKTTDKELSYWLAKTPEKITYGYPPKTPGMHYLDRLVQFEGVPHSHVVGPFHTLEETLHMGVMCTKSNP